MDYSAFNQYEVLQRQQRAAKEQERAEQYRLASLEVIRQQSLREQERHALEQQRQEEQRIVEEQAREQERRIREERQAEEKRWAGALRIADQQRNAAQHEAHKYMEEIRLRRPDIPYDTFAEQYFHEAWHKAHPDIILIPQFHIARFRVDFAHALTKTAIELDGSIHSKRTVRNRDAPRHRYLETLGWRVVRFTNDEVSFQLDVCIEELHAIIAERMAR